MAAPALVGPAAGCPGTDCRVTGCGGNYALWGRGGQPGGGGGQIRIGAAGKGCGVARARTPGVAGNVFNKYSGCRARRVWRGTASTNIPGGAHAGGKQEQGVEFTGGRPAGSWGIYFHQVEILRRPYIYSVVEQGDEIQVGNGAAAGPLRYEYVCPARRCPGTALACGRGAFLCPAIGVNLIRPQSRPGIRPATGWMRE